jgi:hypothetical protein
LKLSAVINTTISCAALVLFAAAAGAQDASLQAQPADAPPRVSRAVIAPDEDVKLLTLVRSSDAKAVVRFGDGILHLLALGDRIGRTKATVTGITPGRLVLDEVTEGADGKPLRAQIVVRDGETGGKRYLGHPDIDAPLGTRPQIVDPAAAGAKPAKKPGSIR